MNITMNTRFEDGLKIGELVPAQAVDFILQSAASLFYRSESEEKELIERIDSIRYVFHGASNYDFKVRALVLVAWRSEAEKVPQLHYKLVECVAQIKFMAGIPHEELKENILDAVAKVLKKDRKATIRRVT